MRVTLETRAMSIMIAFAKAHYVADVCDEGDVLRVPSHGTVTDEHDVSIIEPASNMQDVLGY